jgi:uncharacterized membrane protein YciS (DUF1049 family)
MITLAIFILGLIVGCCISNHYYNKILCDINEKIKEVQMHVQMRIKEIEARENDHL